MAAPDLLLFDTPGSPCARRVKISMIEKGLPFRTHEVDLARLEQRSEAYLAINPNGLVPTLVHDGFAIWESNAITEYLDEIFPDPPLYPVDPVARSAVKRWQALELALARSHRPLMYMRVAGPMLRLAAGLGEVLARARRHTSDPAFLGWEEKVWRLEVLTEAQAVDREAELLSVLERLEEALTGHDFLVEDRFTTADVSMFPRVQMLAYVGMAPEPRRFPCVCRWSRRLAGRPSFRRTRSPMDQRLDGLARSGLLARLRAIASVDAAQRSVLDRVIASSIRPVLRRAMGFAGAGEAGGSGRPIPRIASKPESAAPAGDSIAASKGSATATRNHPEGSEDEPVEPLVLWGDPREVETQACLAALRPGEVPFHLEEFDVGRMQHRSGAALRLNPVGDLPVLLRGEEAVVGLGAVVERIALATAQPGLLGHDARARARVRMWCAFDAGMHKEVRPLFYRHVIRPALLERFASTEDFLASLPDDLPEADRHWIRSVWDDEIRVDMGHDAAVDVLGHKLERLTEELSSREFLAGTAEASFADLLLAARVESVAAMPLGLGSVAESAPLRTWRERIGTGRPAHLPGGMRGRSPSRA